VNSLFDILKIVKMVIIDKFIPQYINK